MINLISKLCGKISPLSVNEYKENGGFKALEKALLNMNPEDIIDEIHASKLFGRGGAAFPTALKWRFVRSEKNDTKYVICNADEGEPGTFKDKVLLNGCPLQIIEGMIIAAFAVGANKGYIYIRGEYPKTRQLLKDAVKVLNEENYLGKSILRSNFDFDIEIRSGAGAYVCGEETALIESIEGNPGRSRFKPPYPPNSGLWGKPTLVNNVETLANIAPIINIGWEKYAELGTENCNGTKLISVSGCVENKGVFEVEYGITLRQIINDVCGGIEDNKEIKFVQLGGSSGAVIPESMLDIKLDTKELRENGIGLGSGAIFVAHKNICIVDFIKATMEFFKHESCGKCTPCREGNRHIAMIVNKLSKLEGDLKDLEILQDLTDVMKESSLCGLGQAAPTALYTTLKYFKDEYIEHIEGKCSLGVCEKKGEELENE